MAETAGNPNIQQMAVLMLNPQLAAQQQKFQLQQAMAQQMMQEGAQQLPDAQLANPGGMVIKNSPLGGAARGIEKALGAYMMNKNLDDQTKMYQGMAGNNPSAPEDPNAPSIQDKLTSLLYGDKIGTAGYETRVAGYKKATEQAQTPVNQNGHMTYMTPPALQNARPVATLPAPHAAMSSPDSGAAPVVLPAPRGANPSPMSPQGNGGPVNLDFNNPAAVKGAETASSKGAESGNAYQDNLVEASSHAIEGKRIVEQMKENLKGFEPGKLATAKSQLDAWGQALGFDKSQLDAELGNVGDVQSFNKLTAQLAIQAIKQISPKATQMEFQRFLENNPNPDLSPDAMNTLIDYTGKTFDLPLQKQQAFTQWKKSGNSLSNYADFDSQWNKDVGTNMPKTLALHKDSSAVAIPAASDIQHLKENPSKAALFDKAFGAGAAQKALAPAQSPSSQGYQ